MSAAQVPIPRHSGTARILLPHCWGAARGPPTRRGSIVPLWFCLEAELAAQLHASEDAAKQLHDAQARDQALHEELAEKDRTMTSKAEIDSLHTEVESRIERVASGCVCVCVCWRPIGGCLGAARAPE